MKNLPISHPFMSVAKPGIFEQWATRAIFLLAGFAMSSWAALIPFAKQHVNVNAGMLGALLLCLGIGALIAMPICGALAARFGCKRIILITGIIFSLTLPVLLCTDTVAALGIALFVFGFGIGGIECAMSVQAVIVEKAAERPLMSGFHGFYSVGCIIGSGLTTLLLLFGLSPSQVCLIGSALIFAVLFYFNRGLLNYANPPEGPAFAIPRGMVLLIGVICFIMFMSEGSILDWSAVYLTESRGLSENLGGLGFGSFAVAMTIGRLTGDKVVARFGPYPVALAGALIAALGLGITIIIPVWQLTLLGYALMGLGSANISPVMFSAVGRQKSMPQAVAVPALTTIAYSGVLTGPAIIGFVAHHSSLTVAFGLVTALLLTVSLLLRLVRF